MVSSDREPRGRAVVTGGAARVGRSIALALGAAGYDVTVHYHRSESEAMATVRKLRNGGRSAEAVRADLMEPAEIRELFQSPAAAGTDLEILVNNAALFRREPPASVSVDSWDEAFALNARAPFLCAQAAYAQLRRRAGVVINVADISAFEGWPAYVPYAASKAALVSLTRGLARAWAPEVRVNAVCPGAVMLPAAHSSDERRVAEARSALGRLGKPEDVAEAVVFLAEARFITGEVLCVDGGTRLRRA
jgi:pteridine reductase